MHRKRRFCKACLEQLKLYNMPVPQCACELQAHNKTDKQIIPDYCPNCTYDPIPDLVDTGDCLVKGGQLIFQRPFVEKPINGDDHNINIYHQNKTVKLFRKIDDKSSETVPEPLHIRTNGCYIYEKFLQSDGRKDLKVYTIYPNYFLCEMRKAPYVDGIVERDPVTKKEKRYPTELSEYERTIAQRICTTFNQLICGFDIIRFNGQSLVMDVNGFSFVKGNEHYYQMCAQILRKMIIQESKRVNIGWTSHLSGLDKNLIQTIEQHV